MNKYLLSKNNYQLSYLNPSKIKGGKESLSTVLQELKKIGYIIEEIKR